MADIPESRLLMTINPTHFAHSLQGSSQDYWHTLEDHLTATGSLAGAFADAFQCKDWGTIAGRWHDLGKYSAEFQKYIRGTGGSHAHLEEEKEESSAQPKVDHSTAGAQHAVSQYGNVYGKILAYCIAGHHSGLQDDGMDDGQLGKRLQKTIKDWSAAPSNLTSKLVDQLSNPFLHAPAPLTNSPTLKAKLLGFRFALLTRMLFSALVDGDFLDTEAFMDTEKSRHRKTNLPSIGILADHLVNRLLQRCQQVQNTPLNLRRAEILKSCLKQATQTKGFFSMTVPTGGGKTFTSLAFGLKHAAHHGLRRVIYAVPYTSIIEQNAEVFRNEFSEFGEDIILEHHSNFPSEKTTPWSRLAGENWDAPLVVTTNVQFFESLFANRTSQCRKIHRIAKSVIVLDEAQSIPIQYLEPCLSVLRELVEVYGCSIVFCTATQPALAYRPNEFPIGIQNVRELIPKVDQLFQDLSRVRLEDAGVWDDTQLSSQLKSKHQVLCILSKRDHAKAIFESIQDMDGAYHLSTRMCASHRSEVLQGIKQRLREGLPTRVVSTQLIEAGVDIDFPVVFRILAGLDSIAQAAGRCNREGKIKEGGKVVVFEPSDINHIPKGDLRQAAQITKNEIFRGNFTDWFSPKAIEHYFKTHYWIREDTWDAKGIMEMFHAQNLTFKFKTCAQQFSFIPEAQTSVIVPWGVKGREMVEHLYATHQQHRPVTLSLERKAQRYSVPVYDRELSKLQADGTVECLHDRFYVLAHAGRYDEKLGLLIEAPQIQDPHQFMA